MPNFMKNRSLNLQPSGRPIGEGVELELQGDLKAMKECFSVNFCFGSGIAYHFGVSLKGSKYEVFQGFKDDDMEWEELDPVELDGDANKITICLSEEVILVKVNGEKRFNDFETKVPLETINSVELWDDINWVKEINLDKKGLSE